MIGRFRCGNVMETETMFPQVGNGNKQLYVSGRVYEIRKHVISSSNIIRNPILFQYIIW